LIYSSSTPEVLVWVFWALKEAVYKIYYRTHPVWQYAPSKISCFKINRQGEAFFAQISYKENLFFGKIMFIDNSIIHAVACTTKPDLARVNHYEFDNQNPIAYTPFLRAQAILTPREVVEKNAHGIPNIIHREKNTQRPISISHHGRKTGIALF